MALSRFPIETTDPRIQVTLPVGRHVLELVVEDSAGLRSAPDQVIIEVRQEAVLPTITGINPVSGTPGSRVEAVISGTLLSGATKVTFAGTGVNAAIGTGGTATSLPVVITIEAGTATGSRAFTVITPAGSAASPSGISFTVVQEPQVRPIVPTPRAVLPEPGVLTPDPITPEPRAIVVEPRAVTPEPRAIVVEPRAVTPAVTPVTPAVTAITPDVRALTPDVRPVVRKAVKRSAAAKTPPRKGKK
jgi:hypothetical protein